ncbi:hypothetical protein GCM10010376_93990 [Streptomyces violaceusniger]
MWPYPAGNGYGHRVIFGWCVDKETHFDALGTGDAHLGRHVGDRAVLATLYQSQPSLGGQRSIAVSHRRS